MSSCKRLEPYLQNSKYSSNMGSGNLLTNGLTYLWHPRSQASHAKSLQKPPPSKGFPRVDLRISLESPQTKTLNPFTTLHRLFQVLPCGMRNAMYLCPSPCLVGSFSGLEGLEFCVIQEPARFGRPTSTCRYVGTKAEVNHSNTDLITAGKQGGPL